MLQVVVAFLVLAADPGSADTGFDAGMAAYERGDYLAALSAWVPAAKEGHPEAQYRVGRLYDAGRGVPRDRATAADWYRKAAEQGHTDAQLWLGFIYAEGLSVPRDQARGIRWFQEAAEAGVVQAQMYLGKIYREGGRVRGNPAEALKWYRMAAEQGEAQAQYEVGLLLWGFPNPWEIPWKDPAEAAEWFRKAAEQGHLDAQDYLGVMYARGEGVPQDDVEAVKWIRGAAERGHGYARVRLGKWYMQGEHGLAKDEVHAYVWLALAAAQDALEARHWLNKLRSDMTPEQLVEAERLVRERMSEGHQRQTGLARGAAFGARIAPVEPAPDCSRGRIV